MKFLETGDTLATAAAKAGMDQKTASKWRQSGQLPSEAKETRSYRTRPDAFAEVWSEVEQLLERDAAIEAKTIFDHLCRQHQGKFQEGQLRILQRKVKVWQALKGQPREVFFPQVHLPGHQAQSDFTHMTDLRVVIAGQVFKHLAYHFTLTYSNWEWARPFHNRVGKYTSPFPESRDGDLPFQGVSHNQSIPYLPGVLPVPT
jgi:hypothetical protein